jgi:hypothetical protein
LPESYLQDAVPDLLGEHQLSIGGNAEQRRAKRQTVVDRGLYHVSAAQQIDETAKQILVEELRLI